MGQAKQRGSKVDRQQAALQAKEFAPLDAGSVAWHSRRSIADRFAAALRDVAANKQLGEAVTLTYSVLLRHMWECEYRGACHSTSAILFVLMSERGLRPRLCIGEVRAGGPYFDHSWIELDGDVFDVAVSLPDLSGAGVGGPVFASVDLFSGEASDLEFGISDGEGLGTNARIPYENTLDGYAEAQRREMDAGPDIWRRIVHLAPQVGFTCTVPDLIAKYGNVKREYRPGKSSDLT